MKEKLPAHIIQREREWEEATSDSDLQVVYKVSKVREVTWRLDKYLAMRYGKLSRHRLQKAIQQGRVTVNGQVPPRVSYKLKPGDEIVIFLLPPPPKYFPSDMDIEIILEDEWMLVVNKPSGLTMHPGSGHKGDTLADFLVYRRIIETGDQESKPGIVHRLDRPTSGVLLTCKTLEGKHHIGKQFFHRTIKKEYLALVWGHPPDEGFVECSLAKCPGDRFHYIPDPEGLPAYTTYKVAQRWPEFSLVKVYPKTGRTHQIRVHLDSIGHPILGDHLYGKLNQHLRDGQVPGLSPDTRLLLHAHEITFLHPATDREITLRATPSPDYQKAMQAVDGLTFDFEK